MLSVFGYKFTESGTLILAIAIAAFPLFSGSSALVFAKGQIHTGLRWPKWRLAMSMLTMIALVFVAASVCVYRSTFAIDATKDVVVVGLSVSPDSTKVAVESRLTHSYGTVWILDLESGQQLFPKVNLGDYSIVFGKWSRDSRRYARVITRFRITDFFSPTRAHLAVLDFPERIVHTVREEAQEEDFYPPKWWSPSGDQLYCIVRGPSEGYYIEHASVDGTVTERIPLKGTDIELGGLVRDDPPTYWLRYKKPDVTLVDDGRSSMFVDLHTGEQLLDVFTEDPKNTLVTISPDLRYVIYKEYDQPYTPGQSATLTSEPPSSLKIRDIMDGTETELSGKRVWVPAGDKAFSADSNRFLAYSLRVEEQPTKYYDLWIVDIANARATLVFERQERRRPWREHPPRWSLDGTRIAMASKDVQYGRIENEQESNELIILDLDDLEVRMRSIATGRIGAYDWLSADELLYADGKVIYRIKADGTGRKKVFPR